MKVCVVGAGAIGGYMAVRLAHAGHAVSAIARGPHLAAIRANGLKLIEGDQELVADRPDRPPTASASRGRRTSCSSP